MDISDLLTIIVIMVLSIFAVGPLLEVLQGSPLPFQASQPGGGGNTQNLQPAVIDISSALSNPSVPSLTKNIIFTSGQLTLSSKAIASASKVEISEGQICMQLGDFNSGETLAYIEEGKSVGFVGQQSGQVDIYALCENGENIPYALAFYPILEKIVDLSICDQGFCSAESKETCCIVILKKP